MGLSDVSVREMLITVGLATTSLRTHEIAFVEVRNVVMYGKRFFLSKYGH